MSTDESLQRVSAMIREVIGEDWDLDEEITMETSFSDDLELESIEFVSLAEKIQAEYGDSVDFVTWLSSKELDEIIALKVGALVDFIEGQRSR